MGRVSVSVAIAFIKDTITRINTAQPPLTHRLFCLHDSALQGNFQKREKERKKKDGKESTKYLMYKQVTLSRLPSRLVVCVVCVRVVCVCVCVCGCLPGSPCLLLILAHKLSWFNSTHTRTHTHTHAHTRTHTQAAPWVQELLFSFIFFHITETLIKY